MKICKRVVQTAVASALLAFTAPASAQIAAQRNSEGVLVYTNDDTPNSPIGFSTGRLSSYSHPTEGVLLEPFVRRVAEQHHLDPRFVDALIRVESDWNPQAISPKGAEGLMQLIPATSRRLGVRDAFDPSDNVRAGVTYLDDLVKRFGGDLRKALAAYYAGEGAVDRAGGVPASPAITTYVRQVLNFYFSAGSARQTPEAKPGAIYETVDEQGRTVFTNQ